MPDPYPLSAMVRLRLVRYGQRTDHGHPELSPQGGGSPGPPLRQAAPVSWRPRRLALGVLLAGLFVTAALSWTAEML